MRLYESSCGSKINRATNRASSWTWGLVLLIAAMSALPLAAQDWPMFGQNTSNTGSSSTKKLQLATLGH
jgi:hypothetical protein